LRHGSLSIARRSTEASACLHGALLGAEPSLASGVCDRCGGRLCRRGGSIRIAGVGPVVVMTKASQGWHPEGLLRLLPGGFATWVAGAATRCGLVRTS